MALVRKVRLFSIGQIAAHWWADELANARRRLTILGELRIVERISVAARTLPPIDAPVLVWQPGNDEPEFGQIAYVLQHRWKAKAVRTHTAYIATQHAAQLLGGAGCGDLKYATQATHDLGVAAVWVRLHSSAPAWAEAWRGEDLVTEAHGDKRPDAFIVNARGESVWVIEFGGSYDAQRVQALHEYCVSRNLPYQIW